MGKETTSVVVTVHRASTGTYLDVTYEVRLRKQALAKARKDFPTSLGWKATIVKSVA